MFGRSKRAAAAVGLATLVKTVAFVTVLILLSPGRAAAAGPDGGGSALSGAGAVQSAADDALEIGQAVTENGSPDDLRLYQEEAELSALNGAAGPDPESEIKHVQDLLGVEFDRADGMSVGTEWVDGALVSAVRPDSVAARTGVRGPRHVLHCALDAAIVAAGFFLPPLFVALPMVDEAEIGESQDLIIAVDGDRIRNAYDLDAHLRGLGPRDLIYLTVLRQQRRYQFRLAVGGEATP